MQLKWAGKCHFRDNLGGNFGKNLSWYDTCHLMVAIRLDGATYITSPHPTLKIMSLHSLQMFIFSKLVEDRKIPLLPKLQTLLLQNKLIQKS